MDSKPLVTWKHPLSGKCPSGRPGGAPACTGQVLSERLSDRAQNRVEKFCGRLVSNQGTPAEKPRLVWLTPAPPNNPSHSWPRRTPSMVGTTGHPAGHRREARGPPWGERGVQAPALPASDFRSKSNGNVRFAGESRHLHYSSRLRDAQILSWLPSSTTRFAGRR